MKTNNNILFLTIIFSIIVLVSCQKQVLENDYYMGMYPKDQFSTPDRIKLAAVGMYNALQSAEFLGGRALIYVDVRSDIVNPGFPVPMSEFTTLLSTYGYVSSAWLGGYQTIFQCNSFIKNLNENPKVISTELADSYIAEARFIRSLVYFYMLNFWGQQYCSDNADLGIPLVLEPAEGSAALNQLPSRATIDESYNQIIEDLEYAETYLPAKREDGDGVNANYNTLARANKASARAILSRVYLYRKDYAKSILYGNKVINSIDNTPTYELDPNLATSVFLTPNPSGSREPIFFVAMNANDNPNTNNALGQHYSYNRRGDITVSQSYVNSMDTNVDKRYTELIRLDKRVFWTKKYEVDYNASWVPVIRYAEILLNQAEALARTNSSVDPTALGYLNQIRTRSGLTEITPTSHEDFLDSILLERSRELAFEGHASFDLFRNEKGVPARGQLLAIQYPNNWFALPIPQSDIERNPNLIQNTNY
ncbi:MAG: RagB/SusD family nutrient uptake outer membrane protein [Chitinophagaceae bacterium]